MRAATERVGQLKREADAGGIRLALLQLMGALRDIEARTETEAAMGISLRFHPDGSGHIEIESLAREQAEPIFEFDGVNELISWCIAGSAGRALIEASERLGRITRRNEHFAKLDLFVAAAQGKPC